MDDEYYECTICCYATNNAARADDHEFDYQHRVVEAEL